MGISDITGLRSGSLTVIRDSGERNSKGGVLWECLCDCGNVRFSVGYYLKNNKITSCGCKNKRTRSPSLATSGVLYWIHDMHDSDIYSQGYVGITVCGFHHRVRQHFKLVEKGAHYENMNIGLKSATIMAEQVLEGSLEYLKDMENHFRPYPYIGWNRAIGGDGGGAPTHGLTGNPIKSIYYGMLTRSRENGGSVDDTWLGDQGLPNFYKDMGDRPKGSNLSRKNLTEPFSASNCVWKTRQDVVNDMERNCNIEHNGKLHTYQSLADILGIKPNTLQYRILRGWTLDEAVSGIRAKRTILTATGERVVYTGSLTDEDFAKILKLRFEGTTTTELGKIFNMDPGQISRICSKLKVKPNEVIYD